jgi:hypothetical protein
LKYGAAKPGVDTGNQKSNKAASKQNLFILSARKLEKNEIATAKPTFSRAGNPMRLSILLFNIIRKYEIQNETW